MDLTREQLLNIKQKYAEKQTCFYVAYIFQNSCLKRIKKLEIDSEVFCKSPSSEYIKILNKRFANIYIKLKIMNALLKSAKTTEQIEHYIALFKIDELDKDLPHTIRLSRKFYEMYKDKGFVPEESLENLESINKILSGVYQESIQQLQYCIDVIDKSLESGNTCELQK